MKKNISVNDVTIIIPTSVIPSHPSTQIIDETISSVRYHFPNNEIIIQIDGLREEQLYRKDDYDEYKNRLLWKCLNEWANVLPIVFDDHKHQVGMMKETIHLIKTELLLYVESDTPLVKNETINWEKCFNIIAQEKANTVRFYHDYKIPPEHRELFFDFEENFVRTTQWSQRPHLSTVSYYNEEILKYYSELSFPKDFIEDRFHGKLRTDCRKYGLHGWFRHKLWLYLPEKSETLQTSYHLNGRGNDVKFNFEYGDK